MGWAPQIVISRACCCRMSRFERRRRPWMLLHSLQTGERPEDPVYGRRPNADMVRVPGGTFRMGSDKHYPEEAPVHGVTVDEFWIDRTPVTNRQFKEFVEATGHVTFAEILPIRRTIRARCRNALCRIARLLAAPPPGRSARMESMVDLPQGRGLASSPRTEEQHQQSR